jgi:hypothetical protein
MVLFAPQLGPRHAHGARLKRPAALATELMRGSPMSSTANITQTNRFRETMERIIDLEDRLKPYDAALDLLASLRLHGSEAYAAVQRASDEIRAAIGSQTCARRAVKATGRTCHRAYERKPDDGLCDISCAAIGSAKPWSASSILKIG